MRKAHNPRADPAAMSVLSAALRSHADVAEKAELRSVLVPRYHHRGAGAAELWQIAVGGHAVLKSRAFPANNRTIGIRLGKRTLQTPSPSTSAVA